MSDTPDQSNPPASSEREELRTIAFRMREMQRLLSIRVTQENRKLEAEGIEPVTDGQFRDEGGTEEITDG